MNPEKFLEIMHVAENLKNNTRHSWTSTGRHESVAEHSWRLTLMAYLMKDEFPMADINKVMLMCLVHDIGEAVTGDIPSFLKTDTDESIEEDAVTKLLETFPEPYKTELTELFTEMNALETLESKIYKALDKMEAVIAHNEGDITTWLPLEYELNQTYGTKETEFSDYLKDLRKVVHEETVEKINQSKNSNSAMEK